MNEAKIIRTALKTELGASARDISVRGSHYSAVNVTIKKEGFPISKVEEIAKREESIDRCEASGEILSGGNTFIFVDFCDDLIEEVGKRIEPIIEKHFDDFENIGQSLIPFTIEGIEVLVTKNGHLTARPRNTYKDYYINTHNLGTASRSFASLLLKEKIVK